MIARGIQLFAAAIICWTPTLTLAEEESTPVNSSYFAQAYRHDPLRPRGIIWPVLFTTLLPGLDQWMEGQTLEAATLSGVAFGGLLLNRYSGLTPTDDLGDPLLNRNDSVRTSLLGSQLYSVAGSFSAYHSLRSAMWTRSESEYSFLKLSPTASNENISDIMLAPFEFSFIKRKTTWIPLTVLVALFAVDVAEVPGIENHNGYNGRDFAFGSAISYNAGTNEEALFRGTLMPIFRESWRSDAWSNLGTAAVFGAAHISESNRIPWPQFLMGLYLGWLTQENNWSVRESAFLHAWWDVVALNASYFFESRDRHAVGALRLPTFTYFW